MNLNIVNLVTTYEVVTKYVFSCHLIFFQASWTNASKKQREKLLELIRRLAEDDKDGVMAHKVLNLLWNLAHSDDVPVDIMDLALSAHIKILDYSCSQVRVYCFAHFLSPFPFPLQLGWLSYRIVLCYSDIVSF